jgi:16S rRNA (adenine1518-N6/adenine1519-N6)-dimethyltransferase
MKNYRPDASQIAEKRYGQNFLEDQSVVERIIQSMPDDGLPVVEIGPGLGDLTKELVRIRRVTAYEVDPRLCDYLAKRFAGEIADGRLRLECGDVLERWKSGSLCDRPYRLVANLPYYIATTIILNALKDPQCQSLLTMVQKEVAEKFAAREGERSFSALSVLAGTAGEASIRLHVPPEAFNPPPKVDSAVLEILKDHSPDDEAFEAFLRTAFRQPRKTLFKNLASSFPKRKLEAVYTALGLERTLRPHQVGTSLYHRLYHALTKETDHGKESKHTQRKQQRTE